MISAHAFVTAAPGTRLWLVADGWSLWPMLRPGSRIEVEVISAGQARVGDVVLRLRGSVGVLHICTQTQPLRTESIVGQIDGEIGPVVARWVSPWPRWLVAQVPRWATSAKRLPLAKRFVRRLRGR